MEGSGLYTWLVLLLGAGGITAVVTAVGQVMANRGSRASAREDVALRQWTALTTALNAELQRLAAEHRGCLDRLDRIEAAMRLREQDDRQHR